MVPPVDSPPFFRYTTNAASVEAADWAELTGTQLKTRHNVANRRADTAQTYRHHYTYSATPVTVARALDARTL